MRSTGMRFSTEASRPAPAPAAPAPRPAAPALPSVGRMQSATYCARAPSHLAASAAARASCSCQRQPGFEARSSCESSQTANPAVLSSSARSGRPASTRSVDVLPARAAPTKPSFAQRSRCSPCTSAARKASRAAGPRAAARCRELLLVARLQGSSTASRSRATSPPPRLAQPALPPTLELARSERLPEAPTLASAGGRTFSLPATKARGPSLATRGGVL
mmetsp:Transcript_118750/g.331300  ORF Transcript_118750/g.331300 Transcript_118750/m.331300 type:complete len:220 (+) Transcript_118750:178-837(+)